MTFEAEKSIDAFKLVNFYYNKIRIQLTFFIMMNFIFQSKKFVDELYLLMWSN